MTLLSDAVENLYPTFSPYRLGDDFVGCDCCVDAKDSAKLGGKPVRRLTYDDLEHYARKAMTTWGDVRHFKHSLPRLLELTIAHRDEFLDLAVVFGKLSYAQWHSWPPHEFEAAERFLNTYWEYQLNQDISDPRDDAIDTVLCAEANARDSVQSLLDVWLAAELLSARKHLAAFVLLNADCLLQKQRLWNAFWDRDSKPHHEVIIWLQSDEVSTYLSKGDLTGGFEVARYQLEAIRAAFDPLSA